MTFNILVEHGTYYMDNPASRYQRLSGFETLTEAREIARHIRLTGKASSVNRDYITTIISDPDGIVETRSAFEDEVA